MSFKFIVYTVADCDDCNNTKDLIKSQGMSFAECMLETQEQIDEFHRRYGHTTVPQVYLATDEQEYIGDYADLEKFMLEVVDGRRRQVMGMSTGLYGDASSDVPDTIHVRQGRTKTTISKEKPVRSYNITINEKNEMKDITPKNEHQ